MMPCLKERVKKALPSWLLLLRRYRKTHAVFPNLLRPGTLNEKILYRILFDRRPILRRLADKAAVRPCVEARLAPGGPCRSFTGSGGGLGRSISSLARPVRGKADARELVGANCAG